jgi:hypothetical protein
MARPASPTDRRRVKICRTCACLHPPRSRPCERSGCPIALGSWGLLPKCLESISSSLRLTGHAHALDGAGGIGRT